MYGVPKFAFFDQFYDYKCSIFVIFFKMFTPVWRTYVHTEFFWTFQLKANPLFDQFYDYKCFNFVIFSKIWTFPNVSLLWQALKLSSLFKIQALLYCKFHNNKSKIYVVFVVKKVKSKNIIQLVRNNNKRFK